MKPALELAQRLGHDFGDAGLLLQALTHRSFSGDHNERLEFLGDAVLGLCVSELLFERLPNLPEGDLSRIRANLVRQESLHRLALQLRLPDALRLGEGERRCGGLQRPSILADALEALLGAVYLDGGFQAVRQVVRRLYAHTAIHPDMAAVGKDPKTELQEWLQARKLHLPGYQVTAVLGAAHQQVFEVRCDVPQCQRHTVAQGPSRRAAEQAAAALMLAELKNQP